MKASVIALVCVCLVLMASVVISTVEAKSHKNHKHKVKVNAKEGPKKHFVKAKVGARTDDTGISYTDAALADEVIALPGAPDLSFRHFSGYLTVDEDAGRHLFYWYVVSENAPATDPVAMWTNGGPGCSGLIGMLTENGPFRPQADGTVELNEYAWNTVSNMFFIEAPAGVGFSYSETERDYIEVGDYRTSHDNYKAILQFFIRFPHLLTNEFYISSESYGGHYMPTLALVIVEGNLAGVNQAINFKGFAVGNPYTDPISNGIYGEFPTYWGHQLISKGTWDEFVEHCYTAPDNECPALQWLIYETIGDIDPYALDFPTCDGSYFTSSHAAQTQRMHQSILKNRGQLGKARFSYDACEDDYASTYLARDDVISSLHANAELPYDWSECSYVLQYNYTDMDTYMEPIYLELLDLQSDIKLLVYSGDDDAVCATIGTQYWIYDLGLPVRKSWTAWYLDDELAGYIVHFSGLTFMTIHTAGHMVPATQPERALYLWTNYLAGTLPYYDEIDGATVSDGTMPEGVTQHQLSDGLAPYPIAESPAIVGEAVATAEETDGSTSIKPAVVATREEEASKAKTMDTSATTLAAATTSPQQKMKLARADRRRAAIANATPETKQKAAAMAKVFGKSKKGAYHPHRHAEARRAINKAINKPKLH